jgi:hypothetical protein
VFVASKSSLNKTVGLGLTKGLSLFEQIFYITQFKDPWFHSWSKPRIKIVIIRVINRVTQVEL